MKTKTKKKAEYIKNVKICKDAHHLISVIAAIKGVSISECASDTIKDVLKQCDVELYEQVELILKREKEDKN